VLVEDELLLSLGSAAGPFLFPGEPLTPGPELGVFASSDEFAFDELSSAAKVGAANKSRAATAVAENFMSSLLRWF
jgi:hypothetical protein